MCLRIPPQCIVGGSGDVVVPPHTHRCPAHGMLPFCWLPPMPGVGPFCLSPLARARAGKGYAIGRYARQLAEAFALRSPQAAQRWVARCPNFTWTSKRGWGRSHWLCRVARARVHSEAACCLGRSASCCRLRVCCRSLAGRGPWPRSMRLLPAPCGRGTGPRAPLTHLGAEPCAGIMFGAVHAIPVVPGRAYASGRQVICMSVCAVYSQADRSHG